MSDHRLLAFVLDGNGSAAFCHSPQEIAVRRMRRVHDPVSAAGTENAAGVYDFGGVWGDTAASSMADIPHQTHAGIYLRMRVYVFSGNFIWRIYFIFTGKNRMVSGACAGDACNCRDRCGTL